MPIARESENWMRPALAWLFDQADQNLVRKAITDPASLSTLRVQLERSITVGRSPVPAGDRGNNLILALIALRLKFPRSQAEAKLETNLALRQSA